MNSILQNLLTYVLIYKYFAIFVITFLGAILLPVPSGSVLMAAAAFSTQGYMNIWLTLIVGIIGNMSGDNTGYFLARRYGAPLLKKIGFKHILTSENFEQVRKKIDEHPIVTIYISRFMTAVAPTVNIICGLSELDYKRFLTFEALGEITECSAFVAVGWFFGNQWEYINQFSGKFFIIILAGWLFSYFFFKKIFAKKEKIN